MSSGKTPLTRSHVRHIVVCVRRTANFRTLTPSLAPLDEREAGDLDAGKRAQVWAILAECIEKGLTDTQRLRFNCHCCATSGNTRICWTKKAANVLSATDFCPSAR